MHVLMRGAAWPRLARGLVSAALGSAALLGFTGGLTAISGQATASAGAPGRKIAIVTGSTDGLGREVALRLADSGMHVVIHGRNRERGEEVVAAIASGGKGSAKFYAADFSSLAEVRAFADTLRREYPRIDLLINNAGIWGNTSTRLLSRDGHELHFAVNYLAGFLLTRTLLPSLEAAAPSRIINVASTAQTPLQFDDVMLARGYSDGRGYGQSKLAQVMFTFDLARELADRKIAVNALHPATLMATSMVLSRGTQPRATIDAGATAVMNLVMLAPTETGLYFNGLNATRANAQAYDEAAREALRRLSVQLTTPR